MPSRSSGSFKKGHIRSAVSRGRTSPWALAFVDALASGPLSIEMAVAIGAPLVPPGRAYRRYQSNSNIRIATYTTKPRPSDERIIDRGAKMLVQDSIHSMLDYRGEKSLRKFTVDNVDYIELTDTGKRRFGIGGSDGREDQGDPQED